jgi:hypothetical protein
MDCGHVLVLTIFFYVIHMIFNICFTFYIFEIPDTGNNPMWYKIFIIYCCINCGCNNHSTCVTGLNKCDSCQDHTMDKFCKICDFGTFGDATTDIGCQPCHCNGQAHMNKESCDSNSGKCFCTDFTEGHNCERCMDGFHGDPMNGGTCRFSCNGKTIISDVDEGSLGLQLTPQLTPLKFSQFILNNWIPTRCLVLSRSCIFPSDKSHVHLWWYESTFIFCWFLEVRFSQIRVDTVGNRLWRPKLEIGFGARSNNYKISTNVKNENIFVITSTTNITNNFVTLIRKV